MTRRLSHRPEFDLVVIGGGTAGLVTAAGAAALGARVALAERARMGGECLWTGCVPSKALIASGKVAALGRRGEDFGLPPAAALLAGRPAATDTSDAPVAHANARREPGIDGGLIDGAAVMRSMREVRERIAPHDSPERFRGLGVEVVEAEARFLSPRQVEAGGRILTGRRFLIATGSRSDVPQVEGLEQTGYFTNEDAFEREDLPRSVLILGAGPNGCEMAQAYRRLGVEVALVEVAGQILEREEPELTGRLRRILESEGVRVLTGWRAVRAERRGERRALVLERAEGKPGAGVAEQRAAEPRATEPLTTEPLGAAIRSAEEGTAESHTVEGDEILVATGRRPNVEGLGLEAAGVEVGPSGIAVDSRLRTSARHIYAAGDVTGSLRFTHVADHEARTVLANALAPVAVARIDYSVIPWATFTDPPLARVGMTEAEARERHGEKVRTYVYDLAGLDRAITDREAQGCVKLVADRRGRLLGGHILAPHAGTMIVEVALAMKHGIRVKDLSKLVHPYPTMSEGVRRAANEAYRSALSERKRRWVQGYFGLMRRLGV